MSFDKCTHNYSIQDHFTALKVLCDLCDPPSHPLLPSLWQILIFLLPPYLYLFQHVI